MVSEVGRQPWIVYNYMKVEAAATGNTGVWLTFIGVVILYIGLGVTTILVLRGMAAATARTAVTASTTATRPYGPNEPSLIAVDRDADSDVGKVGAGVP